MTKPFIKYAGGKGKLLHEILPLMPDSINTYYEPFVGGGAVFFALAEERRFRSAVISDTNTELIYAYLAVQMFPYELVSALHAIESQPDWNTKERYNSIRSAEFTSIVDRAARFIYLNKLAFNGLWRVNRKGEFNVPFGNYKNPKLCDAGRIWDCSALLKDVLILNYDFRELPCKPQAGDCCYFDPPYVPVSKTSSFTKYSSDFGLEEQTDLVKVFKGLTSRQVACVLSNSDTPLVREWYSGFNQVQVQARRNINSDGSKRGVVSELLITGGHHA
jgi:DNA adenine methylase